MNIYLRLQSDYWTYELNKEQYKDMWLNLARFEEGEQIALSEQGLCIISCVHAVFNRVFACFGFSNPSSSVRGYRQILHDLDKVMSVDLAQEYRDQIVNARTDQDRLRLYWDWQMMCVENDKAFIEQGISLL